MPKNFTAGIKADWSKWESISSSRYMAVWLW